MSALVIETNLLIHDNDIKDHQSRVIEVESWESLQEEVTNNKSVDRKSFLGSLYGLTLPRGCKVMSYKFDDRHGECVVLRMNDEVLTKKLFYKIGEQP